MSTMATSKDHKVSLKLFIDTKGKRVVFAEAGKDFVDFLFVLLHLPIGTVVRLLTKQAMVGSLGNLYDSIENLSESYFQPSKSKQSVLKPNTPLSSSDATPFFSLDYTPTTVPKRFLVCRYCFGCFPSPQFRCEGSNAACPQCRSMMYYVTLNAVQEVELAAAERGFVKGILVTYMVMDDLSVTPISSFSTLLNKFDIKEVSALEERIVDLGLPEGLKLLKASLHSKTVLTNVFLGDTVTCSRKPEWTTIC